MITWKQFSGVNKQFAKVDNRLLEIYRDYDDLTQVKIGLWMFSDGKLIHIESFCSNNLPRDFPGNCESYLITAAKEFADYLFC